MKKTMIIMAMAIMSMATFANISANIETTAQDKVTATCDKKKAECKKGTACDAKKAECKKGAACDAKKAECKKGTACNVKK